LLGGIVCSAAVSLKFRLGYDDSLDVVGVHMAGGIVGALATGVFSTIAVNEFGADGLLAGGGFELLGKQALAVGVTLVFSFVVTIAIAKLVDVVVGLRITEEEEISGLDLSLHQEVGYSLSDTGGGVAAHASAAPTTSSAHAPNGYPVPSGGEA
jgi:Amt family ammonium transporter